MAEQYIMTQEELQQLHRIELELISEVDRICKKCGIHYNMVGGTMLGAIRHKGFIPWDDDADIGFLRKEYERFREACKTELDHSKYYLQDIRDTEGYRWGYGKLRRKGTQFVRLNQEFMPYEQGVFIDLMPFDNIPDNWLHRRIHYFMCFGVRKILWSEVGSRSEKNLCQRMIYKILSKIPRNVAVSLYEKLINVSVKQKKSKQVRILTFPTPKGVYGYNREWYTCLSRYTFEDISLPGARDYDGYLKVKYGSYMDMPPEEKRKVHPVSELKLLNDE